MNLDQNTVNLPLAPTSSTGNSYARRRTEADQADIVIIGNGIAGLSAALEARRLDTQTHIVLVTARNHPTLSTSALKYFLAGRLTRDQLLAYPVGKEQQQRIAVRVAHVERIQASSQCVDLSGGEILGYHSLLIATGSTPRGLPPGLAGRDFDGVVTAHTLRDYLDLRRRLCEVKQAVVVGGGVHALETVQSLVSNGISVHWLIRSSVCLPHYFDDTASQLVLDRVRKTGAQVTTDAELVAIAGRVGAVVGVRTTQHDFLPCQIVIACTGTTPLTTLASKCDLPLHCNNGIQVDEGLRTSVPSVYAAGDVADLPTHLGGRRRHWNDAEIQGVIAATMMVGDHLPSSPRFSASCLSTAVGRLQILAVGDTLGKTSGATIYAERTTKGIYRRVTVNGDRVIGYLWMGATGGAPDTQHVRQLIDDGLGFTNAMSLAESSKEKDAPQIRSSKGAHAAVESPPDAGVRNSVMWQTTIPKAEEQTASLLPWGSALVRLQGTEAIETFGAESSQSLQGDPTLDTWATKG